MAEVKNQPQLNTLAEGFYDPDDIGLHDSPPLSFESPDYALTDSSAGRPSTTG
jgi:hypothetical protein